MNNSAIHDWYSYESNLDEFDTQDNHFKTINKLIKEKNQIQDDFDFLNKYKNSSLMKMYLYYKKLFN